MREFYSFIFENSLVGLFYFIFSLPLLDGAHLRLKNTEDGLAFADSESTVAMNCTFLLFSMLIFFLLQSCAILLSLASEDAPVFYTVRKSQLPLRCVRVSEYSRCIILTNVRGAVRCGQVGAGLPGLGFETSLAGRTVLSSGVVLTVALKGPVTEGALTGVEVTLTPVKTGNSGQLACLLHCSHRQGRQDDSHLLFVRVTRGSSLAHLLGSRNQLG